MKKVKSSDTLFKKSSLTSLLAKNHLPTRPPEHKELHSPKLAHSKQISLKAIENRCCQLQQELNLAIEQAKHTSYLYEAKKNELVRLKKDHHRNLKQIQTLNLMIGLTKKHDQATQVSINEPLKGSYAIKQRQSDFSIMRETMKDLCCHRKNEHYEQGFKTMYKQKKKEMPVDMDIERTLQKIRRRKAPKYEEREEKEAEKVERKMNRMEKVLQIKKLSNSPYSKVKAFYPQ